MRFASNTVFTGGSRMRRRSVGTLALALNGLALMFATLTGSVPDVVEG